MFSVNLRRLSSITAFCFFAVCFLQPAAQSQQFAPRRIVVNIDDTAGPVDRFFDLSVGSDYPGTLIRDDSQAQLKLVVDELGFRYIRFHAIFHDVLGTVRFEDGKTVYNWSKIDQLYDDLLARHIKPFVELGFTPKALATSQNRQHVASEPGRLARSCRCLHPAHRRALRKRRGSHLVLRSLERAQPLRFLGRRRPESILRALRPDR
jgi:hypothetical protein